MAAFELVSIWNLPAPREAVWRELSDLESWPQWWPAFSHVTVLQPGAPDGLGRVAEVTVASGVGYRLTFVLRTVEVVPNERVVGTSAGHLRGTGTWTLATVPAGTRMVLVWAVDVTRPWMRAAVPVAARLFRRSHDRVMARGERGLARRLLDAGRPGPGGR